MQNVDYLISKILVMEGGYVNDPNDSGGETNWGITSSTARRYGYTGPMITMKREDAHKIYLERYWLEPGLQKVAAVAPDVAAKMFDISVNMGTSRAIEFLQRILNVLNNRQKIYPDLRVDKSIGPKTIEALVSFRSFRKEQGLKVMLEAMICLQGAFYINLAEAREKDESFVYGWILNRVLGS
jgi:typhoid toxin secretion A